MKRKSLSAGLRRGGASFVLTIAAAWIGVACHKPEQAAPPPPEVSVVTLADASVPLNLSYTARARGEREVEVRARVSGILEKRFYVEGSKVAAGALLFRIDPKPFAAITRSAKGRLGVEQARLAETEQQVKRVNLLVERGLMPIRERDAAQAAFASAQAAVAAATADLESANLDLAYTEVRAPIGGITGREARSEGSLVNAADSSSLLTTIAQSDRLYVDFSMPEAEARLVREALAKNAGAVLVRLQPQGGEFLAEAAQIEFLDARVDGDSGTVPVRATLSNAESRLAPGQFVRARLEGLNSGVGVYVPARAVLYGADGPFVWKIDAQNIVQFAPVRLSPGHGNLLRADEGLVSGDRVIVDGVLKVAPAAPVKPIAVKLDAAPAAVASGT